MQITKATELASIPEVKILSDVRLIHHRSMNFGTSQENLRVTFSLTGDVHGKVTCYLCLDEMELTPMEQNYIFPLFIETMNILIGRQLSQDPNHTKNKIMLSAPKLNKNSITIDAKSNSHVQMYELELSTMSLNVMTEYQLELVN